MNNVNLINGHIDEPENGVRCKDCKYSMFYDCYGKCSLGCKEVISQHGYCNKGERKDTEDV